MECKSIGSRENRENTEAVTEYKEQASVYQNEENYTNSTGRVIHEHQQYFKIINDKVMIIMKPNSKFHFIGKLKVYVLYGSIDIFGYNCSSFSSESLEVYSPRGSSFIPIKSTNNINKNDSLYDLTKVKDYLLKEGINLNKERYLLNKLKECTYGWAVILLENFENTLTTFLNNFCLHKLFPTIEFDSSSRYNSPERAEIILQAHLRLNGKTGNNIEMPSKWNTVALNLAKKDFTCESRSRFIVFGGRGVGKSTAIRYLINKTLEIVENKKIILLDLDPGQAECTPLGSISLVIIDKPLLGPNFTHIMTPYYEVALGEISIAQCISHYINSVAKLIDILNNDPKLKELSVIANTMGYCKGAGENIACSIIKLFQPTDVIQMVSNCDSNNFNCHLMDAYLEEKNLTRNDCDVSKSSFNKKCKYNWEIIHTNSHQIYDEMKINLSPYEKREITLMSYLSKIIEKRSLYDKNLLDIKSVKPYAIPYSSIYIYLNNNSESPNLVLNAINRNIVALCSVDVKENENYINAEVEGVKVFVRNPIAKCYGHAIVRDIDTENKLIFINTPLKLRNLRSVNCFVGCTKTPNGILELDEHDKQCTSDDLSTDRDTCNEKTPLFQSENLKLQS